MLPSGRRTNCIQYRNSEGIKKRFKIGVHGQITSEEARTLAKKYLSEVAHGRDPQVKKKENKKLLTIKELVKEYLERHAQHKRAKSRQEDQYLINNPNYG